MNILIIGGAYQGKRAFAEKKFHLNAQSFSDGADIPLGEKISSIAVDHLHLLVRRMLEEDKPVSSLRQQLEGHIVLCDELGCGVVPAEKEQNDWREATGRLCCDLAERADQVYWLRAGIAQCIKEKKA